MARKAPVATECELIDVFEEHEFIVNLPAVVACVTVTVCPLGQAVAQRVVAHLARMHAPPSVHNSC